MSQEVFVRDGQVRWQRFATLLDALERNRPASVRAELARFAELYRDVCHDLALARGRGFDLGLVEELNGLALRGHHLLYRQRRTGLAAFLRFFAIDFPRSVRAHAGPMLLAGLVFYGASIASYALVRRAPELVYAALPPSQVAQLEAMYDPSSPHHLKPRGAEGDLAMFGFYISNNVGIGFRTFASGLFLGIGSFGLALYNGVVLGVTAAHLEHAGFLGELLHFVITHGALELTAIVLFAGAGAVLGLSLVAPGRRRRREALEHAARGVLPVVYGASAMLVAAAAIEAFWSADVHVPAPTKVAVGATLWALVHAYLFFAGGRRAA